MDRPSSPPHHLLLQRQLLPPQRQRHQTPLQQPLPWLLLHHRPLPQHRLLMLPQHSHSLQGLVAPEVPVAEDSPLEEAVALEVSVVVASAVPEVVLAEMAEALPEKPSPSRSRETM